MTAAAGEFAEQTPEEWLERLFSDENCAECGLGAEGHNVVLLMGNYFARCKNPVIGEDADREREAQD